MIRTLLIFIASISALNAQDFRLNGEIVNNDEKPISYVTLLLMNLPDSTFVAGTATNNEGAFLLQNIQSGNYLLKASMIGFDDFYQTLKVETDIDLGRIIIKESSEPLEQVTVLFQRPTVQREIDRLIFNVENTSLSNGSSMDILKRTPSVIVQQNGITVQNQPATIYINDRKVNISPAEIQGLLEGFAGSNINSIEVITSPGSRYDAENGIVINIVTSKNITPGYKGSLSGTYEQAVFPKYRGGTSHYFKNEKINFFVNYDYRNRKEHKNDLGEVTFFEPDNSINSLWETDFQRITRYETHNVNSFLEYSINEKTSINLGTILAFNPKTSYSNSEIAEIFNPQMQLDSLFTTSSDLDKQQNNIAVDLSLDHRFNDNVSRLKLNAHFTNFDETSLQNVNTNYFLPNGDFLKNNSFSTDANQDIAIYVGGLDFESRLLGMSIEAGGKISLIDTESGIDFFDINNGMSDFNEQLSDHFEYQENVYAGYISFGKKWEKWAFRLGLRGEYTETTSNSITLSQVDKNDYMDWFPNAILNFSPNQDHDITFSYSRNIQRPNYSLLNPFSYFINENNFTTGDPNLEPAISNRYSIQYLAENKYTLEFYYRTTQGAVDVLSFQNNENRFLRSISTNIEDKMGYGFVFRYFTHIRDWWSFFHYSSLFHEENSFLAIESNNEPVTVSSNGLFFQLVNSFTLSKDKTFTGDITLIHLTGLVAGTYLMDELTTVSLGLRKSLWSNRASISLTANDIFNTTNRKLQTDYLDQRNSYYAKVETQNIQLRFIYNFGNFSLSDTARQIRIDERNRID